MEFNIRKADYSDIPAIMQVMADAQKAMEHPEWFCSDCEEYMKKHIDAYGFTIIAEALPKSSPAGFFLYKIPGSYRGKPWVLTQLFRG